MTKPKTQTREKSLREKARKIWNSCIFIDSLSKDSRVDGEEVVDKILKLTETEALKAVGKNERMDMEDLPTTEIPTTRLKELREIGKRNATREIIRQNIKQVFSGGEVK